MEHEVEQSCLARPPRTVKADDEALGRSHSRYAFREVFGEWSIPETVIDWVSLGSIRRKDRAILACHLGPPVCSYAPAFLHAMVAQAFDRYK
jgi:hypothetical protein